MPDGITPLIAGNWKMNGLRTSLAEVDELGRLLSDGNAPAVTIALCPPATLLAGMSERCAALNIFTGGQDCHAKPSGAHTGDISAVMLRDAGARYVIIGHSERRADHNETDQQVQAKAQAALEAGLTPIICVGETQAERRAGNADAVVTAQLGGSLPADPSGEVVVAYEPVWAIGTGLTPTADDIASMHSSIRRTLVERFGAAGGAVPILYGGSMKPSNAREILALPEVNGGLIGGASLLAKDFHAIISAA